MNRLSRESGSSVIKPWTMPAGKARAFVDSIRSAG